MGLYTVQSVDVSGSHQKSHDFCREEYVNELLWCGHVYNLGGYAKANRELLFRLQNTITIQLEWRADILDEPTHIDPEVTRRLNFLRENKVSSNAPSFRFYTPIIEKSNRYRICFTMMESETVHPDFVNRLNSYDMVLVPTSWNAQVFKCGGVKPQIHTVPLGVNPHIYRPKAATTFPPCEGMTTGVAGKKIVPQEFTFLYLFQPTWRKGVDFLLSAFEAAFAGDPTTALILVISAYPALAASVRNKVWEICRKSRVYILEGKFTERELADIYNAGSVFVCTSLGEGWNLPMCEMAACGKPVIVPRNTAHTDLVNDTNAFLFDPEGFAPYPNAEALCPWYDGMLFSKFGNRSKEQLVSIMRAVRKNYSAAMERAQRFTGKVRTLYTWDNSANVVLDKLHKLL